MKNKLIRDASTGSGWQRQTTVMPEDPIRINIKYDNIVRVLQYSENMKRNSTNHRSKYFKISGLPGSFPSGDGVPSILSAFNIDFG